MTANAESVSHSESCPLAAVDRRLDDVHRQWHEAEKAYFDPEGFRVAIQAAIQTLRTVTFILQKNKRLIPNFDSWYQEWKDRLGADPLMRWMVDARNKIEKQGDLEAHSYVRAEVVASYLNEGPVIEVPAKLFDAPGTLVRNIPKSELGKHIRETGTLRIQRRWIENSLPGHEMLDAVAIAYGRIAELVSAAHSELGLSPPVTTDIDTGETYSVGRGGRLPCMIGHGDARTLNISLSDNAHLEMSTKSVPLDSKVAEQSAKRYGLKAEDIFNTSGDNDRVLESLFKTARTMTEKDGYHVSVFFLLKSGKPLRIMNVEPQTQRDKYLIMRNLANDVTQVDADAVILIGEAWQARANASKPYMRAADADDRVEILMATLVQKEGEPIQLTAEFIRQDTSVSLGETHVEKGGAHFMFAPIYEAWGRPIPDNWGELVPRASADKSEP